MTTYEKFKAGALSTACLCLISISVAVWRLTDSWSATPGKVNSVLVTTQASLDQLTPQAARTLHSFDGVGPQATASLKSLDRVETHANKVLDSTSETLTGLNRPCGVPNKSCGTLSDVNRTLSTVRGTFGQIEVAANHESDNLLALDAQELQLYTDTHGAMTNLNALLASPDVARFLKSTADTSVQVAAIATDVHREADKLTAPAPWYRKLYMYGNTGVNVACLVSHSCPF